MITRPWRSRDVTLWCPLYTPSTNPTELLVLFQMWHLVSPTFLPSPILFPPLRTPFPYFFQMSYSSGSTSPPLSLSSHHTLCTSVSTLPTWYNDRWVSHVLDGWMNGWTSGWTDTWIIKAIFEHFDWEHRFWASTTGKEPSALTTHAITLGQQNVISIKVRSYMQGSQMKFHKWFQPGGSEELDHRFYWLSMLYVNTFLGSLKMTFLSLANIASFPT